MNTQGPLAGIRVVEFAALGPVPFCGMLLADLGAEVLRIDRPGTPERPSDILARGKSSMILDLKTQAGREQALEAAAHADVLMEGLRPGAMERLGLGPDTVLVKAPHLVYTRVTGWGQGGPLAHTAGHDINYIAVAGALGAFGPDGAPPVAPINLVGDFGGGALYAAFGILSALLERQRSGMGQVIDVAMVDGTASMLAMLLSHHQGARTGTGTRRGQYFLDGSAPYYRSYVCADGRWIALGAIEPQFWSTFAGKLGLESVPSQAPEDWQQVTGLLVETFRTRTRDEWIAIFDGSDACVSPVLDVDELAGFDHLKARETYVTRDKLFQPSAAPRFSRTPGAIHGGPAHPGAGGRQLLDNWIARLNSVASSKT
ncbi:CaiB/BaiF CoA transferase family protein [Arvimicrobium flavum]|uniref:CaiB/BaiF CoA transferase family protein n=1 Tax=Arvimicrobium flavum TaxID=3393320 RepID=UPI00237ACA7F|nr:CaiB/BaiF CoA-transferase family protein [Mesorhizobium shangrilense]